MNKEQLDEQSGKVTAEIIPAPITDYIRNNFKNGVVPDTRRMKDMNGKTFYWVDINAENTLHHLKFDSTGTLILNEAELLIELFGKFDEDSDVD